MKSSLVIETGGSLHGIRALFADEVFVKCLTTHYEEGELERLTGSFADYQGALDRFAQAAVGRYLRDLAEGIVDFAGADAEQQD